MQRTCLAVCVGFVLVVLAGCGSSPTAPSPIELAFTADAYTLAVGGITTVHVSAPNASHCWIEPTYGDIACNGGSKVVGPFAAAGYYTLLAHADATATAALTIRVQ